MRSVPKVSTWSRTKFFTPWPKDMTTTTPKLPITTPRSAKAVRALCDRIVFMAERSGKRVFLFIAKRFHSSHPRGFDRRIDAEHDPDHERYAETESERYERHQEFPLIAEGFDDDACDKGKPDT